MSQTRERYFEWTLVGLILIMGGLLFYEGLPFLNGALGAITLYLLLRRVNLYLCTSFSRKYAPWVITLSVTIFVMVPLSTLLWYIIDVVQNVDFDLSSIIKRFYDTLSYLESKTGLDIASDRTLAFLTTRATAIMNMLMSGINNTAINLFTAILLLFFLLSGGMKMERSIARCLPFSDANKRLIIAKISTIVRSNAIGIPLLAIIQGAVATLGYSLCGVNRPIEFGVLTGFASMIPIVGSMLVWVPLSILQYAEHAPNIMPALYLAGYGVLIISNCDNVLRMIMQKRMANTHPLITIFGVVAGLPLFGFMGLIFGPLLVAMFLLFLELFVNQYIIENKDPNQAIVSSPTRRSRRERQQQASGGLHALKERLTRHGPNHNVPSAPQPANAPAATAPAANATTAAHAINAAHATTAAQSAARPNLNLEPKAKSFKSAKAQSKQEKRAAAKQREALEQAQSQRAPETAAPAATRSQQDSRQPNSEGSAARPERKPSAAAARSTKAETKSAASVGIKPEVKTAPSTKAPSKTQPAKTQLGTAQAPQPMPLSVVLTPPTSTPSDLTAFKDLGRSHTARALRRDQRFNLAPDALGREQASGQSLVARAVAQAIGSFDSFDDLEGTSAPATALAPRPLKRPEAPKPSAALSPDALPPAPKETNVSARAARLSRHERKQERTQRALSATSAAGDAARAPQAEAKPRPERAPSAPQAQAKEQVPKQEPKHAPKAARVQRSERSSTARPAARKLQGAAAGKGARASNKPSGRKSGASRRNGRARNLDYQVLRPTHHPTNDLPLHTVVSRSAGFEPERKRPTLRTQLVSVHTAKGTMLADPPRRRPSKRRPYH